MSHDIPPFLQPLRAPNTYESDPMSGSLQELTNGVGTILQTLTDPSPSVSNQSENGSLDHTETPHQPPMNISKPLGFSSFPKELAPTPIAWARAQEGNLVWWSVHEKGGHFAALEQPSLLLDDVEDFVAKVWKKRDCRN